MKKLLSAALLVVSSLATSQAFATTMECVVDPPAYDYFNPNHSSDVIYGANKAKVVFRIVDSKPVRSVIWKDAAQSCGTSGTSCSFSIYPFREYTATATVLYQDGTWDTASAIAFFEDGR